MYDHRDIARAMDLFHFEDHSPGIVFWHPMGWRLYQSVEHFMRHIYEAHGFQEVQSPIVLSRSLWERSGHWQKFGEQMFLVGSSNLKQSAKEQQKNQQEGDQQEADKPKQELSAIDLDYALKPMSCPAHIAIYQAEKRSYRKIPMRLMEFGIVHRNEPSGTLSGCMRLRQFVQDDAHIFCRDADLKQEIGNFLDMVHRVYSAFGYSNFALKISLRPEQRLGSDQLWDKAEAALMQACQALGSSYDVLPGEGAFYGPKIEVSLQDHLGRSWQCGTIQVDFNLPQIFDLAFVNAEGQLERPVMLHQAVLGSLERWIGILLENQGGALPLWLAPVQVAIASVSEKSSGWAETVFSRLKQQGIRAELYASDQTIAKKIRDLSERKVPLIAIVGEHEAANQTINLRRLGTRNPEEISLPQLEQELNRQGDF